MNTTGSVVCKSRGTGTRIQRQVITMEITESQIEFAKRELKKRGSIPAVAGKLMRRTSNEAEFSDLIAIANRAKMELDQEQTAEQQTNQNPTEEKQRVETGEGSSSVNSPPNAQQEKQTVVVGEGAQESAPSSEASDDDTTTSDDPPSLDEIADRSSDQGQSAWTK